MDQIHKAFEINNRDLGKKMLNTNQANFIIYKSSSYKDIWIFMAKQIDSPFFKLENLSHESKVSTQKERLKVTSLAWSSYRLFRC